MEDGKRQEDTGKHLPTIKPGPKFSATTLPMWVMWLMSVSRIHNFQTKILSSVPFDKNNPKHKIKMKDREARSQKEKSALPTTSPHLLPRRKPSLISNQTSVTPEVHRPSSRTRMTRSLQSRPQRARLWQKQVQPRGKHQNEVFAADSSMLVVVTLPTPIREGGGGFYSRRGWSGKASL